MPVAVASPGIERTVVACFLDRIEYVVELQDMAAPGSFADIDPGAGSVVDTVVADGDCLAHGQLDPCDLLFVEADRMD